MVNVTPCVPYARRSRSHHSVQSLTPVVLPAFFFCLPHRTHKQYYYTNSATGESQWDYPIEAAEAGREEEERWDQSLGQKENSAMFNRASSQDDSEARARGSAAMMHGSVMSGQLTAG